MVIIIVCLIKKILIDKLFCKILTVMVSEIILSFLLFLQSLKLKDPKVKSTIWNESIDF